MEVPSINYPYFPKFFHFFAVKLKLLRKSNDISLLRVTKITLVLRFMKSNKFYYVQTSKVINSKDVSYVKGSNFVHSDEFSPTFQTLIF